MKCPAGPTLLDSFLPEYEFRGIRSLTIHASAVNNFRALKEVTLFAGRLFRAIKRLAGA